MMLYRPLSRPITPVYFVLSASFVLSSLQNVTVDDAALTGDVVLQYLPSPSAWQVGNNCSSCGARPNPALAYDGTWHDMTYMPSDAIEDTPGVQFTFVGSGLYVFFIIANEARNGTVHTLTSVDFVLDDAIVGSYTHNPLPTTEYEYDVVVYANDSLVFGQHTMLIGPKDTGNISLILFDYFIYTTTGSETTMAWVSETPTAATKTVSKPSASNVGYIVGGSVGGVALLLLLVVCLLYCQRKCKGSVRAVVEAYSTASSEVVQTSHIDSKHSVGSPIATPDFAHQLASGRNAGRPHTTRQPLILSPSAFSPSFSSISSNDVSSLFEQVEVLKEEVARLRGQMQDLKRSTLASRSTAPPDYASQ